MMYYPQGMSWSDIYKISKSSKYFLADVAQYSCSRDQDFVIFDAPDEMVEWFVYQHDGYENDEGQIAKVVGYHDKGECEVKLYDQKRHDLTDKILFFYIPKIEWVYKDKA